jgi:hypothetical protein
VDRRQEAGDTAIEALRMSPKPGRRGWPADLQSKRMQANNGEWLVAEEASCFGRNAAVVRGHVR